MVGPRLLRTLALAAPALLAGCGPAPKPEDRPTPAATTEPATNSATDPDADDPLALARETVGMLDNLEAPIPPQCYTKTEGRHNPCWVCHTPSRFPNAMSDWDLQGSYEFSEAGKTNHWTNLFVDRRAAIAAIGDDEILAWIREDNYQPLREAMAAIPATDYRGYRPDLDFAAGFDERGFARDGSGWRAFRYKPFPGAFWPSNGSSDDVMIRLPARYRQDAEGRPSQEIYAINLAILEASVASSPLIDDAALRWPIEAANEQLVGVDLDGDGTLEAEVHELVGLPPRYVGGAADHRVRRRLYPEGTEFLHSVRYVDPDPAFAPGGIGRRMKELRYSYKFREITDTRIQSAYLREAEEKAEGTLPRFGGNPLAGMRNDFGWQLQGFIEDASGRLRLQTEEEHYFCMGCHSHLGVTVDQSFALPRKLPGAAGWGYQDLRGMPDAPQIGHELGEVETYLARAGAGDELRSNDELIARWLDGAGNPNHEALAGAEDLAALIMPSRERALALAKAYLLVVREQSFTRGRDPVLAPATNVHRQIDTDSTGLSEAEKIYTDAILQLRWP